MSGRACISDGEMIELRGVTKYYQQVPAVVALDLNVKHGEIVGIIGHNGAGKTTTLKMILGLISPTGGEVRVMGHDMTRDSARVKRFVGYLPEESSLYETMTVTEYLLFFAELYRIPRREALARIETLLDSLDLAERNRFTGELSKGMKRKVAIARALLHDPPILILDEPSSGLDPLTSIFIINYLRRLKEEGKTILMSAHNLFHVEHLCDRVAIMKSGRLLVYDDMQTIRRKLGKSEYEVVFYADVPLDYPREAGNYVFRTTSLSQVAALLGRISENGWALVNLAVRESALEEIYVQLMSA